MREKFPLILFIFSLVFFSFLALSWNFQPQGPVKSVVRDIKVLQRYWRNDFGIEPTRFLVDAAGAKQKFKILDNDKMAKGHRLISGLTPEKKTLFGAVLYDQNGNELHHWPIDYAKLDHRGRDPWNTFIHGLVIFEDGSLIVNFDSGDVLSRIGPCGGIAWTVRGNFNHVVSKSHDGAIWTLKNEDFVKIDPKTGQVLKTINLVNDIFKKNRRQGILAIRTKEDEKKLIFLEDPFHPNDVEVLSPKLASAFPMFHAGDLLISLRSLNLVAVIDPDSHKMKWWRIGPWHRQHDPDFLPDGSISVYDNNMSFKNSRIIKSYPASGKTEVVFSGGNKFPFYSWRRGKHQTLENGNLLITDSEQGRVFEVDPLGDVVWIFNNIFDEKRNAVVNKAIHLPEDFFSPGVLDCRANK